MGILSFFSSLFGKAKKSTEELGENASSMANTAIDKTESFSKNVIEKFTDAVEHASHTLEDLDIPDRMENFIDAAKEHAAHVADWAEDKAHDARDTFSAVVDKTEDTLSNLTGTPTEKNKESVSDVVENKDKPSDKKDEDEEKHE